MKTNILRYNSLFIRDSSQLKQFGSNFVQGTFWQFLFLPIQWFGGKNMQAQFCLKPVQFWGWGNWCIYDSIQKQYLGLVQDLAISMVHSSLMFDSSYYFQLFILSVMPRKKKIYVLTLVRGKTGEYHLWLWKESRLPF